MGCTYRQKWNLFGILTTLLLIFAGSLYIAGGVLYHNDRYAKNTHEPSTCEVISSSYYESRCRSGRYGRTVVCFVIVWMVTYSIDEAIPIDATIQRDGLLSYEATQNRLDQHRVGMSYSCWYSVVDPSTARWDEPSTFIGMMFLIGAGILSVLGFVGIFFSYRAYRNLQMETKIVSLNDTQEVKWHSAFSSNVRS